MVDVGWVAPPSEQSELGGGICHPERSEGSRIANYDSVRWHGQGFLAMVSLMVSLNIQIISARKTTRKERRYYEEDK